MRVGRDACDLVAKNESQRVDTVDADVRDWAATADSWIVHPRPCVLSSPEREFSAREHDSADFTGGDAFPNSLHAVFKAKNLCDSERQLGSAASLYHLATLVRIEAHWLLHQHRFSHEQRGKHVRQVK